jgi:hypothetical protein
MPTRHTHPRSRLFPLILPLALLAGCLDRELPTAAAPGGPSFLQVPVSNSFTEVSAGDFHHTCALRSDGVAECWGSNADGQAPAAESATTGNFTQVSGGGSHTCALRSDGVAECWGSNSLGQAPATRSATSGTITVLPIAAFGHPVTVPAGTTFSLELNGAQVPGHPEATSFTYAFDCGDRSGYGAFGASDTASCPTSAAETRTVRGTVQDQDGDVREYTGEVTISEQSGIVFSGFFAPVENLPTVNVARAGGAIPVKFSLGGDQGLDIFASGYPKSEAIACDASAPLDVLSETVTAGGSSLSYDALTGTYTYVWKTEKGWKGTCRRLTVRLSDGTEHQADFNFSK